MGRLRRRLDGLEQHAHETMTGAEELVELAKDLIQDLQDGVKIEIEVPMTGNTLIDLLLEEFGGELPFVIRIDPRDEEEKKNE